MQLKIYRYIFTAYGAILLASLALFYLLPKDALSYPGTESGNKVDIEIFRELVYKGEVDQLDGVYLYKQWRFDYDGDRLEITSDRDGAVAWVLVKRSAPGTGEIAAFEYRAESFLTWRARIDRLEPYRVALTGNRLSISGAGYYKAEFKAFDRDFSFGQFSEKNEVGYIEWLLFNNLDAARLEFAQMLYLHIPADVELAYDSNTVFLTIIGEE